VRLALTDLDAKGGRELCGEIKERGLKNDMVFAALDCTGELSNSWGRAEVERVLADLLRRESENR